ncbi:MAG: hypothetical protein FJ128_10600 [Deltaproteobacteria bacterium]|nr:hypothetical protein [Deltaproteobacteria bacterium]
MLKRLWPPLVLVLLCLNGCASEEGDWGKASAANDQAAYEWFLKKYPHSVYTAEAKKRLTDLAAAREMAEIKRKPGVPALEQFILKFSSHPLAAEARAQLGAARYDRLLLSVVSGERRGAMTFGHQHALWKKPDSKTDDQLIGLSGEDLQQERIKLRDSDPKTGLGDLYWLSGDLYFDRSGSIFNEENAKNRTRLLEVVVRDGDRLYYLLKISPRQGSFGFEIVGLWREGGPPKETGAK